ncbi:hypothetical protein CWI83_09800 [Pseudidiomarina taiwanensis]|uniref:VanZ-like domain-containing protein n=2 Tax=Pseudidiomarina taiwanensis TaxID=337250 RepID=A0A432ZCM4_9GAMM|nr:hypothetical protein CWI83_09800 [Pseudidiomarina taiwanensis]
MSQPPSMNIRKWSQRAFILLLVGLTIAFVAQVDQNQVPRIEHLDKLVHFGAFFLLAWTFHQGFATPWWLALLCLGAYAVLIEWIQSTLPYRSASLGDFIADGLGVLSYFLVAYCCQQWRQRRSAS